MESLSGVVDTVSGVVTAGCAAMGLFFLARQNGLLRQQLARPGPIVSVDAEAVAAWGDARWRALVVTIYNASNIPLEVLGFEVLDKGGALLWTHGEAMADDGIGGSVLSKVPPNVPGRQKLPLTFQINRADTEGKPGPRRSYFRAILRVGRPDQPLPKVRLTYRWKTNNATTIATVAVIWDRDATA